MPLMGFTILISSNSLTRSVSEGGFNAGFPDSLAHASGYFLGFETTSKRSMALSHSHHNANNLRGTQFLIRRSQFFGGFGHAPDQAGGFVLDDRVASGL